MPEAKARPVITSIKPLGMNFLVFASRIANTTSNAAMITSANPRASPGPSSPGIVVTISAAAEMADVISDTLLPAFRKPIRPPTNNKRM